MPLHDMLRKVMGYLLLMSVKMITDKKPDLTSGAIDVEYPTYFSRLLRSCL